MAKPLVAIIGRPNVGKSTFFNRMAGQRIAIVDDRPGVTRDRLYADTSWLNYDFTIIDTAGIDPLSDDELLSNMRAQAEMAIELAQVILFFVDGKDGIIGLDEEVGAILRNQESLLFLLLIKLTRRKTLIRYMIFISLDLELLFQFLQLTVLDWATYWMKS